MTANPQNEPPVAQVVVPSPYPPPSNDIGQDVGMRMLLPVGRSWVAIVAGYLGLLAVLLVPAPLALIVGVLAIVHIKAKPGRHGMGRAIFGIVMGALCTALLIALAVSGFFS